ncbi:hypothetical protein Pint_02743 [Pistacia integerrima]|uniref:Uncharacterized protein n=1 Tax=Pistacia integerrima TaxID=434235 RepID=A0ACC0ZJ09_9ROSI|nr:hypothetical protein Pint_02743 [Pistacia integerrima]
MRCLDLATKRVYISRDVIFDEKSFPAKELAESTTSRRTNPPADVLSPNDPSPPSVQVPILAASNSTQQSPPPASNDYSHPPPTLNFENPIEPEIVIPPISHFPPVQLEPNNTSNNPSVQPTSTQIQTRSKTEISNGLFGLASLVFFITHSASSSLTRNYYLHSPPLLASSPPLAGPSSGSRPGQAPRRFLIAQRRPSRFSARNKRIVTFDDNLKKLVDEMFDVMYKTDGTGLSAPQVGMNVELMVFNPVVSVVKERKLFSLIEELKSIQRKRCFLMRVAYPFLESMPMFRYSQILTLYAYYLFQVLELSSVWSNQQIVDLVTSSTFVHVLVLLLLAMLCRANQTPHEDPLRRLQMCPGYACAINIMSI